MVADDLDGGDVNKLSHVLMRRERRDALERLTVSSAVPVRLEFGAMERGPAPLG